MRIWSLHPKYLDSKGLVALWRESLLAKHVLEGTTKGYKNHPQLNRFKLMPNPVDAINQYLSSVYDEAVKRAYSFDKTKIWWAFDPTSMSVTDGQLKYEKKHLLNKLKIRDLNAFNILTFENNLAPHPIFKFVSGEIANWEIIEKTKHNR